MPRGADHRLPHRMWSMWALLLVVAVLVIVGFGCSSESVGRSTSPVDEPDAIGGDEGTVEPSEREAPERADWLEVDLGPFAAEHGWSEAVASCVEVRLTQHPPSPGVEGEDLVPGDELLIRFADRCVGLVEEAAGFADAQHDSVEGELSAEQVACLAETWIGLSDRERAAVVEVAVAPETDTGELAEVVVSAREGCNL